MSSELNLRRQFRHPVLYSSSNIHGSTMASGIQDSSRPISQPGRFDINALISPPDPVYDDFSSGAMAHLMPLKAQEATITSQQDSMPSPPVSTKSDTSPDELKHHVSPTLSLSALASVDPTLFPSLETTTRSSQLPPLFPPQESEKTGDAAVTERIVSVDNVQRIIHDHIRALGPSSGRSRPTEEDYRATLEFHNTLRFSSNVMELFQRNQGAWLNREKALLAADRHARPAFHHRIKPVFKPRPLPQLPSLKPMKTTLNRVQKPTDVKEPRITKPQAPRPIRTNPTPARRRVSPDADPSRRKVAPNREDKDYNSVEDICPSLSTLKRSFNVEWKGSSLDLSNDRDRHLLHPEEIALASKLRLDCATYLTTKRRIFLQWRECRMRNPPKTFRKTDAQQACKIDVNKASKLWEAFNSVHWFDD